MKRAPVKVVTKKVVATKKPVSKEGNLNLDLNILGNQAEKSPPKAVRRHSAPIKRTSNPVTHKEEVNKVEKLKQDKERFKEEQKAIEESKRKESHERLEQIRSDKERKKKEKEVCCAFANVREEYT